MSIVSEINQLVCARRRFSSVRFILESGGVIDNLDKYVDKISSGILKCVELMRKSNSLYSTYELHFNGKDFKNPFFDALCVKATINLIADDFLCGVSGNYNYEDSGNMEKGWMSAIDFQVVCGHGNVEDNLKPAIAHEITHAYIDRKKNPFRNAGIAPDTCGNYSKCVNLMLSDNVNIRRLGKFLYFTDKNEMSSLASEGAAEITLQRGNFFNEKNANEVIKSTKIYKQLEDNRDTLKSISSVSDKSEQSKLLCAFNSVVANRAATFEKMKSCLEYRLGKVESKIIDVLSKAVYDAYNFKDSVLRH